LAVNQPAAAKDATETTNLTKPDQEPKEAKKKKTCKKKGKDDLQELKKEVQMDEHKVSKFLFSTLINLNFKIPIQELVQRMETDTCKVRFRLLNLINVQFLGFDHRAG
jgi:hypothetical protein